MNFTCPYSRDKWWWSSPEGWQDASWRLFKSPFIKLSVIPDTSDFRVNISMHLISMHLQRSQLMRVAVVVYRCLFQPVINKNYYKQYSFWDPNIYRILVKDLISSNFFNVNEKEQGWWNSISNTYYFIQYFERRCLSSSGCYKLVCKTVCKTRSP